MWEEQIPRMPKYQWDWYFSSKVTGNTYIINHKFDSSDNYLIYLLRCQKCHEKYVCKTIYQFRLKSNNYKDDSVITIVTNNSRKKHLYEHYSSVVFVGFLNHVLIIMPIFLKTIHMSSTSNLMACRISLERLQ